MLGFAAAPEIAIAVPSDMPLRLAVFLARPVGADRLVADVSGSPWPVDRTGCWCRNATG